MPTSQLNGRPSAFARRTSSTPPALDRRLGSGQHIVTQLPYLYVGGADGKLVTGQYVDADKEYLVKFLNTIGAAVGCTNSAKAGPLDDFNSDTNNYRSKNYTYNYYLSPQPAEPADDKPPIKGRLPALVVA